MRPLAIRGEGGFSLAETLVALAVLSLTLVMGLELMVRLPRYREQLTAQQEAVRALEATVESLRAGTQPLVPGQVFDPELTGRARAAGALALTLEVEPAAVGGLYQVRVEARYFLRGAAFERDLETLVWQP